MRIEIYTHDNCGACKANKPLHTLLAKTYPTEIIDPTTDEGAERANAVEVRACPAIVIFGANNEIKHVIIGYTRPDPVLAAIGEVVAEEELDIPNF